MSAGKGSNGKPDVKTDGEATQAAQRSRSGGAWSGSPTSFTRPDKSAHIGPERTHGRASKRLPTFPALITTRGRFPPPRSKEVPMSWVEPIARVLESAGVVIIVIGAIASTGIFAVHAIREAQFQAIFDQYRANLGRAILLGLEFLIAGDIIATILVEPTLERVGSLGLIVLIRTFLSFSLEAEIEGHLPWRRHEKEPT